MHLDLWILLFRHRTRLNIKQVPSYFIADLLTKHRTEEIFNLHTLNTLLCNPS